MCTFLGICLGDFLKQVLKFKEANNTPVHWREAKTTAKIWQLRRCVITP